MGHSQQAPDHQYEQHEQAPLSEHVPSSIAALTPAPRLHPQPQPVEEQAEPQPVVEAPPPPVVEQQRAVEAAFAEPEQQPPEPVSVPQPERQQVIRAPRVQATALRVQAPVARQRSGSGAKAAFTLRLDPDRHLKLRLACAVTHRSAQQIVTEALDEFLASIPGIDAIASQVPGTPGKAN
jgi:hypothetical protein